MAPAASPHRPRIALALLLVLALLDVLVYILDPDTERLIFVFYSRDAFVRALLVALSLVAIAAVVFSSRAEASIMEGIERLRGARWPVKLLGVVVALGYLVAMGDMALSVRAPTAALVTAFAFVLLISTSGVLWSGSPRWLRVQLLLFAIFLPAALAEGLFQFQSARLRRLPDYGYVHGGPPGKLYGEGGMLKPNLNLKIVGERSAARFITNSKGFRNAREIPYEPEARTFRVLYVGDSFVAGYRVDQEAASGAVIEASLNAAMKSRASPFKRAEVLVASLEDPATAWIWLQEFGVRYHPRLVVLGLCLGNDLAQAYAALDPRGSFEIQDGAPPQIMTRSRPPEIGFDRPPIATAYLPRRSVLGARPEPGEFGELARRWRMAQLPLRWLGPPELGIASAYGDGGGDPRLHVFDAVHGLGFFYSPMPKICEEAAARCERALEGISTLARSAGAEFLVALFPQRFQISEEEWRLTAAKYSLNPAAFDLAQPNRRLAAACAERGIACLDLLEDFRAASAASREPLYLPLGDMHWTARGHRIAGEAIARTITARDLALPSAPPSAQTIRK